MHAVECAQEGGLATSAGADNSGYRSGGNIEGNAFERLAISERNRKVTDSNSESTGKCHPRRFLFGRRSPVRGLKLELALRIVHCLRHKIIRGSWITKPVASQNADHYVHGSHKQ